MPNITLSLDQATIKKVRRIAMEKNTTLTAMVREYLEQVAARDEAEKQRNLAALRQSFACLSRDMGERSWRREDLHDRLS
ncbi:MAG TPA: hypothetical protein ENN06_03415 [Desulfobacteraceae bacterium]|jgi:hypothetical protein|nr:hypothetical protein [Desulfobacteraceae bacterium]